MDNNKLIKQLEKAQGPCRELDAKIEISLKVGNAPSWFWKNFKKWKAKDNGVIVCVDSEGRNGAWLHSQNWTSSIDAALTLVPDGCVLSVDNMGAIDGVKTATAEIYFPLEEEKRIKGHYDGKCIGISDAATITLALCAAALQAKGHIDNT